MTAALGNFQNGAFNTLDAFVYPQFLVWNRTPGINDILPPGTRVLDKSQNPNLIYETSGAGNWDVGGVEPASTTVYGVVLLTDNSQPVATKAYADALAIAGAPAWSETVSGIGQLSTNAEAVAGTDDNTAITPLKLAAVLVAGVPITGGAGSFTTLTATLGDLTVTNGDLVLGTAGNKLSIATGVNASVGTSAALAASTATVTTTAVTASSKILLTRAAAAGTLGNLSVGVITAGTSFTITTDNALDLSTVNWLIIN